MFESKKLKKLEEPYKYYQSIKVKTDKIYYNSLKKFNVNNIDDDIIKEKFFYLIVNLCNQVVYDNIYVFKEDDFDFIKDYNINIINVLDAFIEDIMKMKKIEDE